MPDLAADLAQAIQALQDIRREPSRAAQIAETALADLVRRRMGLTLVPEGRVAVRIPPLDTGQCGWAKWVIAVDPGQRGGFMFEGPFLPMGQSSPVTAGAVVLIATGIIRPNGQRWINGAIAWLVDAKGELHSGIEAHRDDWKELAERIDKHLRTPPLLKKANGL